MDDDELRAQVLAGKPVALPVIRSLIQCRPGCAHCCRSAHEQITLAGGEGKVIAEYLVANGLDTPELRERLVAYAALQERIERVLGTDRGDDYADRVADAWQDKSELRTPCPLLDREREACSVYPVRPWSCRAYDSISEDECKRRSRGEKANIVGTPTEVLYAENRAHIARVYPDGLRQPPGVRFKMPRTLLARGLLRGLDRVGRAPS